MSGEEIRAEIERIEKDLRELRIKLNAKDQTHWLAKVSEELFNASKHMSLAAHDSMRLLPR